MTYRRLYRCYLAVLSLVTLFVVGNRVVPGPSLGVATVAARPEVPGYERAAFGGWLPGTKDAVRAAQTRGGYLYDPYANKPAPARVEVDHVFPLAAAWDLGASTWPPDKRIAFANDPLNLVATDRTLNQTKSDSLPAQWLPPAKKCDYSQRLAAVAQKYELPLPREDAAVMGRSCRLDVHVLPR